MTPQLFNVFMDGVMRKAGNTENSGFKLVGCKV